MMVTGRRGTLVASWNGANFSISVRYLRSPAWVRLNLPWLNPGSLALAMPAPLPLQHLVSMLVYLAELSGSLYLLYRHLEFSVLITLVA
jgi:hypothetical protein